MPEKEIDWRSVILPHCPLCILCVKQLIKRTDYSARSRYRYLSIYEADMRNNKINNLIKIIIDPRYRFESFGSRGYFNFLSDEEYIRRMFEAKMGYSLNLDDPKTFNEKLQWLKLYDRKSIYSTMVDKYAVKEYVSSIIGEEYIIPTIGVWDCFEDINFDQLPNQFVLKCTHDSGGLVIVKDKTKFDVSAARKKINRSLKRNYFYFGREWPYKDVKPRIIAETYMEDKGTSELRDYKIYTFNGNAKLCMINQARKIDTKADYFDRDYNWLDFKWGYEHADSPPKKPKNYELMYILAEKIAAGTIELRVDFYEVNEQLYFGELTFFDGSGFDKFEPIEWDYKLGNLLVLPY